MTEVIQQKLDVLGLEHPAGLVPVQKKTGVIGRGDSAGMQQGITAALRILEPARKKLSTIETQRIIECLDECIRRHELAASTVLILLSDNDLLERYSLALGIELVTAIKSHRTLCRLLEASISKQDEGAYSTSLHQVNESCKNLLRMFSNNLTVATAIRGEYQNVADNESKQLNETKKLVGRLMDLRAIMFERLLTTPIEETDRSKYLLQVSERGKNNAAVIDKLQAQLDAAIEDKEQELSKRNETIRRLKNDLHQIEQFSEEHVRRTKTEADKQQAADNRSSEGKQAKQLSEIEQLQDQLSKNLQEHREVEQTLRKRKYKIETEVDNWITKYDQDMGEKQDEYEQIDTVYTEEKKQLSELEEKFKVLEEEYDKIMEERRLAREAEEARRLELEHMEKAAIVVQAFFRAYKVRKALKAKAKKGGKGKGKKKK